MEAGTRERILRAAAQCLSEVGYAKAHLADIARRASVQPPAIYHYFDSREHLVTAVVSEGQRLVRRHVEDAIAALPAHSGVRARLKAAIAAHLEVELEVSEFATAVTRNAGQLPQPVRDALTRESREFHDVWRALLHEAQHAGALRPGVDVHAGRMLAIGALNWATEWWTPAIPVESVIRAAQELILGGLLLAPGSPGASQPAAST